MPVNRYVPLAMTVGLLALVMLVSPSFLLSSHASSEPSYCTTIGGSWDSGSSVCTLSTYDAASPDASLEVTSGTTLILSCSSNCLGAGLLFESNGTLTIDQGAEVIVQSYFNCSSSCFDIGIDLDGSSTGITNLGTMIVEPSMVCDQGSFCFGIDSDNAAIENYGTISIAGNYSCDNQSLCGGIDRDNGAFVDMNCGTTSPQTSPFFVGTAVTESGGCSTTTVTQTVNDTQTQTQTLVSNSTQIVLSNSTETLVQPHTVMDTITLFNILTVSNGQTVTATLTPSTSHVSNTSTSSQASSAPSSSGNFVFIAAGLALGIMGTIGVMLFRKSS
jgi:hypothetical protein